MNNRAVEVTNLRRVFGKFIAVNDVSFEVDKGEIFGFLGPNGAGKSTTIRMLCGLLRPTSGSGHVAGFDIMKQSEKIKTRIGYMSQKFSLYQTLSVEENMDFYAGVYLMDRGLQSRQKDEFFSKTELGAVRNRLVSELSTGARQLLALFCAIQHEPEIIFLDEPTAGVDPLARRYFWEQINHLSSRGVTVFVTTHYLDEAEECNRIAMIFNGRLAAIGRPQELKEKRFLGTILLVQSENPWEAADKIRLIAGVTDVTLFGLELHVTVEAGANSEAVAKQIMSLDEVENHPTMLLPSLEDLFVALTREDAR